METPFFGHRIALGNAVIGAWFKAYDEDELCKMKNRKYVNTEWWTKAPHLLHFSKDTKKLKRKPGEIYHFLVPDKNMLAVLKIKEEKAAHPSEAAVMNKKLSDWTAVITKEDMLVLRKLSAKIDQLIKECVLHQQKIDYLTQNRYAIWGHTDRAYENFTFDAFDDKQSVSDSRNQKGNAFYKLRTIMDYWCSLWFWEYEDASLIPSRREYWLDIAQIIGIDLTGDSSDYSPAILFEESNLFNQPDKEEVSSDSEDTIEEDIPTYTKEDAEAELRKVRSETKLFDNGYRIPVVQRLADRYHFFHPMLEFIEVFWLRDGFDVICGNPPWIKLEFDEKEIISDKYPEVSIRKVSAPKVREMKERLFAESPSIGTIYKNELNEVMCQGAFLNAFANYPLLVGQQTNLYKCVLENTMDLASTDNGYIGLLTPESIYDDPNGQPLRLEMYRRLRYHFQYQNELRLFAEVHHHTVYGDQLLGPRRSSSPCFASLSNLFHPNTVDACFAHDGHGVCGGIKDENGNWNTAAHRDRIVQITDKELQVLSNTFEDGKTGDCAKLVSIHDKRVIAVLDKISSYPTRLKDRDYIANNCFHETGAVDNGIIKRCTCIPKFDCYEMIYNGPSFYVANPLYKTPRSLCILNSDYDNLDLTYKSEIIQRTNYIPCRSIPEYKQLIPGFPIGKDALGNQLFDCYLDYYKVTLRCMLSQSGERTLICAVLPRKTAHINAVISVIFSNRYDSVDMAGLFSSIPLDFFTKTIGIGQIGKDMLSKFPFGFQTKFQSSIRVRSLLLNCLTDKYKELWETCWNDSYMIDDWHIKEQRLKDFNKLSPHWDWDTPLRNHYERRMALIEIDVISSMSLGLSLEDLEMMYAIQFPVLQQNENDTWYDQKGNIVFTCSKGLTGVGLDRKAWESMRGSLSEDGMTYTGTSETYEHTIDPAKSELYGGQKVTYYAPYNRCDRIEDYRRAWAHFEKVFNEENKD